MLGDLKKSPVKRFLLGAAAGAGIAAAGCLALAGTISPIGAILVLSTAAVGGGLAATARRQILTTGTSG